MGKKRTKVQDKVAESESPQAKKVCLEEDEIEASPKKKFNHKIISWNVDGVRAWLKKDGMGIFKQEDPDIICLQETKCSFKKLPSEIKSVKGYHTYFAEAKKEGYSGVGLISKIKPLDVKIGIGADIHDSEGRCITAEYKDYYVVTAYVPNAGRKLVTLDKRMDWDKKIKKHLNELNEKKPIIYCGDLNVAHMEIDLANPKRNVKNAGFTKEERDGLSDLLTDGYIDSFRHLYPEMEKQYTFWTYMMQCRSRNIGWRLDYFLLSKELIENLTDNVILKSSLGSDHCPISLLLQL